MGEIKSIGGASIGWVNASFPLAFLTVAESQLVINATILGKYAFTQEQVIRVEKYSMIPYIASGIKVIHTIPDYPSRIIFWHMGNADALLEDIRKIGFKGLGDEKNRNTNRGIPVRWQAIVGYAIIWNGLFFLDHLNGQSFLGIFSKIAFVLTFLFSIAVWRSSFLKNVLMRPGRSLIEIKAWLYLIALVTGFFCLVSVLALDFLNLRNGKL